MVDEFIDRMKGRRRVEREGACERVGDFFFDRKGTKWLCTNEDRSGKGLILDIDEVEVVTGRSIAKVVAFWFVGFVLTLGSIVAPAYWFFRMNS